MFIKHKFYFVLFRQESMMVLENCVERNVKMAVGISCFVNEIIRFLQNYAINASLILLDCNLIHNAQLLTNADR